METYISTVTYSINSTCTESDHVINLKNMQNKIAECASPPLLRLPLYPPTGIADLMH